MDKLNINLAGVKKSVIDEYKDELINNINKHVLDFIEKVGMVDKLHIKYRYGCEIYGAENSNGYTIINEELIPDIKIEVRHERY